MTNSPVPSGKLFIHDFDRDAGGSSPRHTNYKAVLEAVGQKLILTFTATEGSALTGDEIPQLEKREIDPISLGAWLKDNGKRIG